MGTKRDVEAFGKDTDDANVGLKSAAAGGVKKFGPQEGGGSGGVSGSAGSGLLNDEPQGGKKRRPVRAWGYLPRAALGGLQQDQARGSKAERQFYSTGEEASGTGGVNSTGRVLKPVNPSIVDTFQGRSGQPDNQDTFRRKGST